MEVRQFYCVYGLLRDHSRSRLLLFSKTDELSTMSVVVKSKGLRKCRLVFFGIVERAILISSRAARSDSPAELSPTKITTARILPQMGRNKTTTKQQHLFAL